MKKTERDPYQEYHLYADKNLQSISDEETRFWKKIIRKYLKPLEEDADEKKKVEEDLIDLRNRVSLFVSTKCYFGNNNVRSYSSKCVCRYSIISV